MSEADALKTGEHAKANVLGSLGANASTSSLPNLGKTSVSMSSLVDGKMVADWIDFIIPAIIVWISAKAGKLLKKNDLNLSEKEKNTLAPLLAKCMDELMINFDSPFVALAVTAGFIYSGKIINATVEKQPAKTTTAAVNSEGAKVVKLPDDKLAKVADELERNKLIHLKREVDSWQPTEEEIEARGKSLRQSPRQGSSGRAKIITSLRNQRLKELMDKK